MTLSPDQFSPMLPGMEHVQLRPGRVYPVPGMEHLQPSQQPRQPAIDAGLERRQARMMRNRARKQGKVIGGTHEIPSMRDRGAGHGYPREYGAEHVPLRQAHPLVQDAGSNFSTFGAFEQKAYAAMGTTRLFPRTNIKTLQATVHPERVEQIRANPAAGRGERTPGFIQGVEHADDIYLTNGNHRAMADLANGALFLPVRTVPAQAAPGLGRLYRDQKKSNAKKAGLKKKARTERQVDALTKQLQGG